MKGWTAHKKGLPSDRKHLIGELRQRGWFARVLTAAMTTFFMASPLVGQQVPEICRKDNGANILKCQKTCAKACEDPEFQYAEVNGRAIYEVKCDQVLAIPEEQRTEAPGCEPPEDLSKLTPYERCVREAELVPSFRDQLQQSVQRFKDIIQNIERGMAPPGLEKEWERASASQKKKIAEHFKKIYQRRIAAKIDFNKGFDSWKCGRIGSPKALEKFYQCIAQESVRISRKIKSITTKAQKIFGESGHGQCDQEEAERASNKLSFLKISIQSLGEDATKASDCLDSIIKWQEERAKRCSEGDERCSKDMDREIRAFKGRTDKMAQARKNLQQQQRSMEQQITNIEGLINRCN